MTEQNYYINERVDEVLVSIGDLAPVGQTDDYTLAMVVSHGLWAGFYLALRHPEWFAELITEGNAALDAINDDGETTWTEQKEWESVVDRLANGERPL